MANKNFKARIGIEAPLVVTPQVVFEGSTSGTVTIAAPANAGTQAYTLPTAVPASTGYVLSSTTGGVMSWVANPPDTNTTYDFNATSTTGGANLNLVGSDSTTDTVKISNGTGVTVAQVSGTEVSVTIGQAVGTGDSPAFAGVTGGNVTVGVDSDQIVSTTSGNLILQTAVGVNSGSVTVAAGVNGDITLAPNGTGKVVSGVTTMSDDSRVYGQLIATPNTSYNPPASALSTILGTNGLTVASSAGGAGNGAAISVRYSSGDTTAGTNSAAAINLSGSSGTSTSPGGAAANQVLGSTGFDGYTAGTSNNFASQIATMNQGGGTASLVPLQAQGYARQAFTNSTTVTTAVTGASGTGSVATLTFTAQNTAPYAVGQTVAIAGMTPSGYNNAAAVITAISVSSISYANTTTGFTSGGTIAAANTVTQAGTGFRVRGFANSAHMTVGNRFNFMDLTASAATFKSATYTFANDVITGTAPPLLTATNYMTLGATSGTTGSINQDIFTIKNTAGTTTYANFLSTGTTISGAGLSSIVRTTVGTPGVAESRPSMNIRLSRSDQAAPNDSDGTGFRYQLNGSNSTAYSVADMSAKYRTAGDNEWNLQLANGDQTTGTFSGLTTLQSKITATTIRAGTASGTPGASTVSDVVVLDANTAKFNVPVTTEITTTTISEGTTYTPAATVDNNISVQIDTNAGGTTVIDLINLTGNSRGGSYNILVFNNTASGTPIQVKNTRINSNNLMTHTITTGSPRIIINAYVVGDYATADHLVVA
jgi:hypothetical protein